MSLQSGAKIGPYEILAPIGAGGMGEAYKARDTRLGREVAVKILPAEFAEDPERLRRFAQEARATAALDHLNILAVFDDEPRQHRLAFESCRSTRGLTSHLKGVQLHLK